MTDLAALRDLILAAHAAGDRDTAIYLAGLADDPEAMRAFLADDVEESVSESTFDAMIGGGRWLLEDKSGALVAKKVEVHPKTGKPYTRTVMVSADEASPAGKNASKPAAPAANTRVAAKATPATRVPQKKPSEKAARAMASAKRVDGTIQRYAEEYNEPRFAKAIGGVSFPDGEPVDVAVAGASGKVAHGIELKTLTIGENDKLTMNAYAQVRKKEWEKAQGATFHTVVSDDRAVLNAKGEGQHDDSKRAYFYRRGIAGSARVNGMYRCKDEAELKKLMAMSDDQLPAEAKRNEGDWLTAGKWVPLKGERGYRNSKTGQEVRPKK